MHIEDLTVCTCEEGHDFYIKDDSENEIDLEDVQCPICGEDVSTYASRTVMVAVTGRDTLELWDYDDNRRKAKAEGSSNE